MAWNNIQFDDALRKKYEVLGQNADSDTTRANATMQGVQQQPGMQAAQDTAAMDRARLAAQTQTNVAGINESGAMARTGMTTQAQRDIAAQQDQGAMARTQLQTSAQRDISGQSLGVEREKLAQQGSQFDRSYSLDTAKAQDLSQREWGVLGRPEYGNPAMNLHTGAMESTLKRPAVVRSGPSALDELTGRQSPGLASPVGQSQASPSAVASPTVKPSPASAVLSSMSDDQLYNAQGQGRRAAAAAVSPAPVSAASSDSSNPRNGVFSQQAPALAPGVDPAQPAASAAPPVPYLDAPQAYVPNRTGTRTYAPDSPANEIRRVVSQPDSSSLAATIAGLKGGINPTAPSVPYLDNPRAFLTQGAGRTPYGNSAAGLGSLSDEALRKRRAALATAMGQ